MEEKTAWWKYPLAILAFAAIMVLGTAVIIIINYVIDFFSPRAFKNGPIWIDFISHIFAAVIACSCLDSITEQKHPKFCYITCLIAFVYLLFTAITNYMGGYSELYQSISVAASGVVCLVMAVQQIKESAVKEKEE